MNSYQKLKAKLKAAKEENNRLRSDIRILVQEEGTKEYYITKHAYGMAYDIQKRQDDMLLYGDATVKEVSASVKPQSLGFFEQWTKTNDDFFNAADSLIKKHKNPK